jgi:purine-binding chemotaxis protein CheW
MSQILPLIRRIAENVKARYGDGRVEKFFLFKLAAKKFAIPAVDVTEVVMPATVISIPEKSDFLSGVINIRGTVVPLVNLRQRLNLDEEIEDSDNSRLIIFRLKSNQYVAMLADQIEYRLRDGIMTSLPPELENSDEEILRNVLIEDKKFHVFFIDQWLKNEEISILQNVIESF